MTALLNVTANSPRPNDPLPAFTQLFTPPKLISSPRSTMSPQIYPTRSTGPAHPSRPLQSDLLQIIPGNPREALPILSGLVPSPAVTVHLFAELDNDSSSICLNDVQSTDHFFQFLPEDPHNSLVTFTVLQTATADPTSPQLSPPLFAKIQTRKLMGCAVKHLLLNDNNGVSLAHLTITHKLITAHDTGAVLPPHAAPEPPRFCGHRGQGGSNANFPHRVLENSLESFLMVTLPDSPVKTVELDVQLTKDGKTIIYHDWFFKTNDKRSIAVHDATFEEFDQLMREKYGEDDKVVLSEKRKALRELVKSRADVSEDVFGYRALGLLDVCESLPEDIGLLVEVKYPALNVQQEKSIPVPKRNEFLDIVLDDLFASTRNTKRKIALLCFEADCCQMLSMKQSVYPVYLSHCETMDKPCDNADPRCVRVEEGMRFAEANNFIGMMLLNRIIAERPHVARDIREKGLSLLTYGATNSDPAFVKQQLEWGVNGVIADDVDVVYSQVEPEYLT